MSIWRNGRTKSGIPALRATTKSGVPLAVIEWAKVPEGMKRAAGKMKATGTVVLARNRATGLWEKLFWVSGDTAKAVARLDAVAEF